MSATNKAEQKRALAEYKTAVRDLNELSDRLMAQGIRYETTAYQVANKRVLDAEKKISKLRAIAVYMFGH